MQNVQLGAIFLYKQDILYNTVYKLILWARTREIKHFNMQNFKDGRCLFAQLFFVAYLWLILYEIYSVWIVPNGQNHLLVLKVPRSGSSWLTSQLNRSNKLQLNTAEVSNSL